MNLTPTGPSTDSPDLLSQALAAIQRRERHALDGVRIERVVVGIHFAGVQLSTGHAGIAYLPPEQVRHGWGQHPGQRHVRYKGLPVQCLAEPGLDQPFARVLRQAAVNALSAPFLESRPAGLSPTQESRIAASLYQGKRVCMFGAVIPLIRQIEGMAEEVLIIDRKEEASRAVEHLRLVSPGLTDWALARCHTAVFTSSTLASGSFEHLLAQTPRDRTTILMGPTAGCLPDPFFAMGLSLVGTSIVTDPELALDLLAEGAGAAALSKTCLRKINLFNPALLEARPIRKRRS